MDDLSVIYETEAFIAKPQFWNSIFIWHDRPNVINRRLLGSSVFCTLKIKRTITMKNFLDNFIGYQLRNKCMDPTYLTQIGCYEKIQGRPLDVTGSQYIIITKLFYKRKEQYDVQIAFIDGLQDMIIFCPNENIFFPYGIQYDNGSLQLLIPQKVPRDNQAVRWLIDKVISKIKKWATSEPDANKSIISLRLISTDEYSQLYFHLKRKYGRALIKIWTECTDPLKFIYEDIAIAAYLCLLWKNRAQKFVDMGCGNGLLVHILNSEGHNGVGLDIRPRKIWSQYPPSTLLKVKTITSSSVDDDLSSDVDWIIGNHSDELTPWIPVKTARNSYDCKFFLLPCCAYEFNGNRYCRRNSSKSVYEDYLDYIESICRRIGFDILFDKLRIPSTKRICLIGNARTYTSDVQNVKTIDIDRFINDEINNNRNRNNRLFASTIYVQPVRNCTRLDKNLINAVVKTIADVLIKNQLENSSSDDIWLGDYSVHLKTLAGYLTGDNLAGIKNQCKGLQTLLKNHHHIFLVEKGRVKFRIPRIDDSKTKIDNHRGRCRERKKKLCWFYREHPYSCPLSDDECPFIHD